MRQKLEKSARYSDSFASAVPKQCIRMITKNTYKSFLLNFETRFGYLYVQERQVMETNS